MSEKKRKGRRAYLDSYKKNEEGNYIYEGEVYTFEGGDLRRELIRLWVLCAVLLLALAAAGCSTAPGADSSAFVLIPYAANLATSLSVCWGMGRLTSGGNPLKAYVYEASVGQLPARAMGSALCSGAVIVGEGIYLFQNGAGGRMGACFLFLVIEMGALILALWIRKAVSDMKWVKL